MKLGVVFTIRFAIAVTTALVLSPVQSWTTLVHSTSTRLRESNYYYYYSQTLISPHLSSDSLATSRFNSNNDYVENDDNENNNESTNEPSQTIYSLPALYDLAFGYRDFEEEVSFLLDTHYDLTGQEARTILELAAGPARHAMEALRRREQELEQQQQDAIQTIVTCIDTSKEMRDYAMQVAADELPQQLADQFEYLVDDMRSFRLHEDKTYDAVWILLGSLQHMISNDDVISCFQSVAQVLEQDGTVTLELPHPRETFSMAECTRNGWEIPLEDENGQEQGELKIIWGDENDHFDPITQVRQFTVAMELTGVPSSDDTKQLQNIREIVPMRLFTAQEIDALARCAGLKLTALFGALEPEVSVDDEDAAFRLVAVLQKI